jgi:predicted RNA-binding Zn ribbon-like protein
MVSETRDSSPGTPAASAGADDAASEEITPVEDMDLIGGEPCLDLVNTGAGRRLGPFREKLRGYRDLVTWAERIGSIDGGAGARLRRVAERDPSAAAAVLAEVKELREAIDRVFTAAADGESPSAGDLSLLDRAAARAAAHRRLVTRHEGFAFEWTDDEDLDRPWWPAAMTAVELLTEGDLTRVKECASDNCNWLFIDESRNRSRRWCDMKDCGNRAKARRFRQRART